MSEHYIKVDDPEPGKLTAYYGPCEDVTDEIREFIAKGKRVANSADIMTDQAGGVIADNDRLKLEVAQLTEYAERQQWLIDRDTRAMDRLNTEIRGLRTELKCAEATLKLHGLLKLPSGETGPL